MLASICSYTALEYAILGGLQNVALAIIDRPDFQEINNVSPNKYTCAHA